MRLWTLTHRRKISGRLLAGSGRFQDAVSKSSGRWRRKKAHRNPAAEAAAARSVFLPMWVEDQNPRSEPDWRLLSINLKLSVINPESFRAVPSAQRFREHRLFSSGERRLLACGVRQ